MEICEPNGIDPEVCPAAVIGRIVGGHPRSRLDELLPWEKPAKSPALRSGVGWLAEGNPTIPGLRPPEPTDLRRARHRGTASRGRQARRGLRFRAHPKSIMDPTKGKNFRDHFLSFQLQMFADVMEMVAVLSGIGVWFVSGWAEAAPISPVVFGEEAVTSLIANVLCTGQISVAADDVVRTLQEEFGVISRIALLIPGRDGSAIITMGSINILVMIEDKPLPLELEEPDATKAPGGKASLLNHRAHAMVSLLNVPQHQAEKMRAVLRLVQIVSAVARCADGSAILWSESGTLLPVEQFRNLTARWTASPDEVPLLLICRVLAYRDGHDGTGQDRYGVLSVGLKSFIGSEVELSPQTIPFEDATQSFDKMAHLLLQAGSMPKEGDLLEVSSSERFRLRYGGSRNGDANSVLVFDRECMPKNYAIETN